MSLSGTRLHGQAVKTQPSHGCNRGSNPLGVTIQSISGTFRCPISFRDLTPVLRLVSRPATGCTLARFALAVRQIPLESPKKTRTLLRPCFFVVRIPVLRLVSRPATGCTLARLALSVRRIPSKPVKNFGRFSAPDLSCLFRANSLCLSLRIASCKARHRRRPRRAALHACPAPRRRRP